MIITEHFIFIHFPKSGGTFIRSALQHNYHTFQLPSYKKKSFLQKIKSKVPLFIDHRESYYFEGLFSDYMNLFKYKL